jgi:RecT family
MSLVVLDLKSTMAFCEQIAKSDMIPANFRGKPENILLAVQWGREVGLSPLQALQNIAVINGRPSIWGDSALALVTVHPECEDIIETVEGDGEKAVATCTVLRKGRQPLVRTFSMADAKKANLSGKAGPWQQYPKRMLQQRARGFALRDAFPDALRGVITTEESRDYPDATPAACIEVEQQDMLPKTDVDIVQEMLNYAKTKAHVLSLSSSPTVAPILRGETTASVIELAEIKEMLSTAYKTLPGE